MTAFLATPPEQLPPEQLHSVLMSAYWTWGDWPALAHYVPRMLDLCLECGVWAWDAEALFHKLLLAARPELLTSSTVPGALDVLGEPMRPEERDVLFRYACAATGWLMADPDPSAKGERVREFFAFLVAFDARLPAVLERWKSSRSALIRARYCLLLAEWVLITDGNPEIVPQSYLEQLTPAEANRAAFGRMLDPAAVEAHLSGHLPEVELLDPDLQSTIGVARDWARHRVAGSESRLARVWRESCG
jgi:hypothetical protein